MLSEDELIKQCKKGDRKAQKHLYDKYAPVLFALCQRYMATTEEAEDAFITGFTLIFSKLDTYKNEGSFEGWMKKIMINNAISCLRTNEKYKHLEDEQCLENMGSEVPSPQQKLEAQEIVEKIQNLPVGYRTVFNLVVVEGYTYEETAKMMNINIGTVRSQLNRARKELQKQLQIYRD